MPHDDAPQPDLPPVRPSGGAWLPPLIAGGFAGLAATWRVRRHGFDAIQAALAQGPLVFAFWHGDQLYYIGNHRFIDVAGMASHSPDGELLARCIERLGYPAIRGSTSRGGRQAFARCLERMAAGSSIGLAVDGPRGPLHQPHVGAAAMAARVGRPIAWMVGHAAPRLQLRSWDRFEIPLPFARVELAYGLVEPAPDPDDRDAVQASRLHLGACMRQAKARLVAGEAALLSSSAPTPP